MTDDDLIRRGDALNICTRFPYPEGIANAIAALPAVTALTPNPVDDSLATDPAVKLAEALTEQLEAARADAKEAEAYAEELEQRLAKAIGATADPPRWTKCRR
jgi:hypothetical protein